MKDNLNEQYTLFINEYEKLLESDIYISKGDYQKTVDIFKTVFDNINRLISNHKEKLIYISNNIDSIIREHNDKFINKKLIEYKEYFDNLFSDIDPNIVLDEEQRKAILIDEDYSLVIAGAGSGKTTTMTAKAKYLIEKCNIKPEEILLMSFTKKAVHELEERINNDFKLNIPIKTFHKLGLDILNDQCKRKVSVIETHEKWQLFVDYFKNEIFSNKEQLRYILNSFSNYLFLDSKCLEYKNFNEYWEYMTNKIYEEKKNNLEEYNNFLIAKRLAKYRCIQAIRYRSEAEVKIANFLYKNRIPFTYEKSYEETNTKFNYKPDFTILLPNGKNIYIEYFGLYIPSNQEISKYSPDEIERYKKLTKQKEKIHQKYGTDLIELFPNENYLDKLEIELNKRNVLKQPITEKEVFLTLMRTDTEYQIRNFIKLIIDFISKFKSKGYNKNSFEELSKRIVGLPDEETVAMQLTVIEHMYNYYNNKIHSNYQVDYEDMINYAHTYIEKMPNKKTALNYKYIIVDEYQDISMQRFNLLYEVSKTFNAKIIAVGDDWQAIFGFSGAEIQLFTKFCELMGYGEIIKITNTYRNSQELIDIAGEFVLKNSNQFEKHLSSVKHLKNPIEILYYSLDNEYAISELLENVLESLYSNNPNQTVLLLGRYNDDISKILINTNFREGIKSNGQIIYKKHSDMNLTFLTVHASKGLGYDQVILINSLDAIHGFPSKIVDDEIISLLNDNTEESIKYAEERRLFYVAITRTKNKVYILTPDHNISSFINEIKNYDNVYESKKVVGWYNDDDELELI